MGPVKSTTVVNTKPVSPAETPSQSHRGWRRKTYREFAMKQIKNEVRPVHALATCRYNIR